MANPITRFESPAGVVDLRAALEAYGLGMRRDLTVCFPACVREYDREHHRVQVVPLIKQGVYNGEWEYIDRKPYWVSVRGIQQGGFAIDVPLYVGDTGWVIASDRDTRLLKGEESLTTTVLSQDRPVEMVDKGYRKRPWQQKLHDLESGFFIPDSWGRFSMGRFKDSTTIGIGDGLYIGHSIDTKDEETISEDGVGLGSGVQKGDGYENKTTSSIIIEREGGVHLMSSPPKEQQKTSSISVLDKKITSELISEDEEKVIYSEFGFGNGILKRIYDGGRHFMFQNSGNTMCIHDVSESKGGKGSGSSERNGGKNVLSISMSDGKTTVAATGDIEIRGEDNITVFTEDRITVVSDNVYIISSENTSVSSDYDLSVNSAGNISIESNGDMIIDSYSLSLGAIDKIDFESGGDINIICASKRVNLNSDGEIVINPGKFNWRGRSLEHSSGYYVEKIGHIYTTETVELDSGVGIYSGYSGYDEKEKRKIKGDLTITGGIETKCTNFILSADKYLSMAGFNKQFAKDVWEHLYPVWGT